MLRKAGVGVRGCARACVSTGENRLHPFAYALIEEYNQYQM